MSFKNNFKKDFALRLGLIFAAGAMLLFSAARAGLFIFCREIFASLGAWEAMRAFAGGLKFDASMTALFLGPALLLLNLPVRARKWLKLWAGLLLTQITALALYLAADLIYFLRAARHIGDELLHLGQDWGFIIKYAFTAGLTPLVLITAAAAAAFYFAFKFISKNYSYYAGPVWTPVKILLIGAFGFLFIRGTGGKPLAIADAYSSSLPAAGASLALNGAFTGYHIARKGYTPSLNNFPADEAVKNMQAAYIAPDEIVPNPAYPLMRQKTTRAAKNFNVLIVLLESWTPKYIDGLSGGGYGVTPVFDQIIKEGAVFTNAYAVGRRSVAGYAAVIASVPVLSSLPVFGEGLETARISPAFKNFADRGYYTFFAQTSLRHSFRLCQLSFYLGAQDCYGWEDLTPQMPHPQESYYGFDEDLYIFAADKIKSLGGRKFFAMLFSGITHEPFVKVADQFQLYNGGGWEAGYLNSLAYADWSIGRLLERAKKDGWFDNTVFVFSADHTADGMGGNSVHDSFHIPIVVYAPEIIKPAKYEQIVSQLDIMPTVYSLAGFDMPYTAFGRNMFDPAAPGGRFAFVNEGINIGLITETGAMRHNGARMLGIERQTPAFDAQKAQETLLSFDKAAYTLLKNNKWFTNEK
ncbi:MAG: sulfatase-like hydrolase/transferase [Elusimicrobiota bacterium]|jgi:phosphoglycerol transferase MdoB-like AlkP superfamily enzyme|nr:sulfatase-like hydrolase/transferase [Elusimicrobiota bacterium]